VSTNGLDKGNESLTIAVNGSLLLDDVDLVIQAALDGAGLAWVTEDRIAEHLESGALIRVLEDWCPPFAGFFLYYPTRKQQARRSHGLHHYTAARLVIRQSDGTAHDLKEALCATSQAALVNQRARW
jgi:DNA-binding transcriptional LysR family regulator